MQCGGGDVRGAEVQGVLVVVVAVARGVYSA